MKKKELDLHRLLEAQDAFMGMCVLMIRMYKLTHQDDKEIKIPLI